MDAQTQIVTTTNVDGLALIVSMVVNALDSEHSQRAYGAALDDFLPWLAASPYTLSKPAVTAYLVSRAGVHKVNGVDHAAVPASVRNLRLTAIKKLAREAADNDLIPDAVAFAISKIKGVKIGGRKLGNWLTKPQAEAMLRAPNQSTAKGCRDRALLAVLLGAGLRRAEVAGLTVGQLQQREGRWVIVDVRGKGNKTRTVAVASWVAADIARWLRVAGVADGHIFRAMRRGDHVAGAGLSEQAVFDVVCEYAAQIGVEVKPHDLRRSFAGLARKGGATVEQIQVSLGHASIATTERYLEPMASVVVAAADFLGLNV